MLLLCFQTSPGYRTTSHLCLKFSSCEIEFVISFLDSNLFFFFCYFRANKSQAEPVPMQVCTFHELVHITLTMILCATSILFYMWRNGGWGCSLTCLRTLRLEKMASELEFRPIQLKCPFPSSFCQSCLPDLRDASTFPAFPQCSWILPTSHCYSHSFTNLSIRPWRIFVKSLPSSLLLDVPLSASWF